ncbi:hypothetical protein CKA32_000689 [Geitlerinema sp. FC II]|nr:hypothetical protein CKA32_000689 [Geitlerinema sp. FC II]
MGFSTRNLLCLTPITETFQSLEGIFGFFNAAPISVGSQAAVSIPRRDFWVFQLAQQLCRRLKPQKSFNP